LGGGVRSSAWASGTAAAQAQGHHWDPRFINPVDAPTRSPSQKRQLPLNPGTCAPPPLSSLHICIPFVGWRAPPLQPEHLLGRSCIAHPITCMADLVKWSSRAGVHPWCAWGGVRHGSSLLKGSMRSAYPGSFAPDEFNSHTRFGTSRVAVLWECGRIPPPPGRLPKCPYDPPNKVPGVHY
jgi:hypothetical protein